MGLVSDVGFRSSKLSEKATRGILLILCKMLNMFLENSYLQAIKLKAVDHLEDASYKSFKTGK